MVRRNKALDQEPNTDAQTDVGEQLSTAVAEDPKSHVERLGREPGEDVADRKATPNPFAEIVDDAVGFRYQRKMYEGDGKKKYFAEMIFSEGKAPQEARKLMHQAGFQFDYDHPDDNTWYKQIQFNTQNADKVAAKSLGYKIQEIMRKEKGMEPLFAQGQQPF